MYNDQINTISVNSNDDGCITNVSLIHKSGKKYNYDYEGEKDFNKLIVKSVKQCVTDYNIEQRIDKILKIKERI